MAEEKSSESVCYAEVLRAVGGESLLGFESSHCHFPTIEEGIQFQVIKSRQILASQKETSARTRNIHVIPHRRIPEFSTS